MILWKKKSLRDHLVSVKDSKLLMKSISGCSFYRTSNHSCFLLNHFNFSFERFIKSFVINYISVIKIRPDKGFVYFLILLASFFLTGLHYTCNFVAFVNFVVYMFIKIMWNLKSYRFPAISQLYLGVIKHQ